MHNNEMEMEDAAKASHQDRLSFDPHQLVTALEQFARGLWTIFLGICLILAALVMLTIVEAMKGPAGPLLLTAAVLVLVGFIMTLNGKQQALAFSAPLRYRRYLVWSYRCDLLTIVSRILGRAGPVGFWLHLISVAAGFLSLWFLLRFIYHLASLIEAQWARRLAWWCQLAFLVAVIGGVIINGCQFHPVLAKLVPPLSVIVLLIMISGAASTIILLVAMSVALKSFSRFLRGELANELPN